MAFSPRTHEPVNNQIATVQPLWPHAYYPRVDTHDHLCMLVAVTVASAFAVPLTELHAQTRRQQMVAFARQSAMYLAHVVLGFTLTEIGRAFGRDRTTAAYACARVETLRDDPGVDAVLEALEHACRLIKANHSAVQRVAVA